MLYQKQISKYALPIIAILAIVSRLPQLLSPELFMDGDECIVGLMAKHYFEGKDVPYFFYGQSYGFTFIEVYTIKVFYSIIGVGDIAVKLAMLLLWTTGILFFYQTLKQIGVKNNFWLPLLITLVFVFSPAWGNWAMKARGGYLTAFVLTFVITYLVFHRNWSKSILAWWFTGFLIVVIYQSQPLFLAGLLPIILYQLVLNKRARTILSLFIGLLVGGTLFYSIKEGLSTFWSPQVMDIANINIDSILSIPKQVFLNFEGSYLYSTRVRPFFVTSLFSLIIELLVFLVLGAGLILILRKRNVNPLFYVLCISVIGTLSYVVLTNGTEPRYLLPLTGYALFMIYMFLNTLEKKKVVNYSLGLIIVLGMISLYDFKNYGYESKAELKGLVAELESNNIYHVYCTNGLLQWQIMFYSNERIVARYRSNVDRYQAYITQVDSAFLNQSEIAMTGYYNDNYSKKPGFISVNKRYYMFKNPSKQFLIEQGFNME